MYRPRLIKKYIYPPSHKVVFHMFSTPSEIKRVSDILANYELPSGEDDCQTKIDEIAEMREKLVQMGFNKSFVPGTVQLPEDLSKEQLREIRKQLREMHYVAYIKKSIIKQLDYAMASYKIAMLHFRSGALTHAYRHLPYDGNVVGRIARFGPLAARMYFDVYELLSGELEQLGISLNVAIPSDEGVRYERLQLYGIKDVDDYVSSLYGNDAEIVKTKIITKHRSILTSKAYRKVLACAYAISAASEKRNVLVDDEKLNKYASILRKHGFSELMRVDVLAESNGPVIDELEREGLVYFAPTGPYLDDELSLKLNEAMNKRYWEYIKDAYGKAAVDIVRLIMITSRDTRRRMGVFAFDDDIQLIKPIVEKAGLVGLVRAYEMVLKKIEMEEAMGLSGKEAGLALFAYFQGKEKLSDIFGVEFSSLQQEYDIVKAYFENGKGRGEKFLEHLKK